MYSTKLVPRALTCASFFIILGISASAQTQPHLVGDAWKTSGKSAPAASTNPAKEAPVTASEATAKEPSKTLKSSWTSTTPVEPTVLPANPLLELEAEVSVVRSAKLAVMDSALGEDLVGVEPPRTFQATAYSLRGVMRSGAYVRRGAIAADPRVLPLGSVVHLKAGTYTGLYTVQDTGSAIKGKRIDVWMGSSREARSFGRQNVRLTVLKYGGNRKPKAKTK
jgi:rare lipoprotein A